MLMKKHLDKIINFVSSLSIYFSATTIFPHINNQDLLQSKVNIDKITALLLLVLYLAFLGLSDKWTLKKIPRYVTIGLSLMASFFVTVFVFYYPFTNKKIVNVRFECGGTFLIGDSINYSKLTSNKDFNYDSLATNDPSGFIQRTECNPSFAWTFDSIEHNYNQLLLRYIIALIFFSLGVFCLLKAALKKILP
jgi:hypothetical protein